jgi:hypothetical protein
VRGAVLIEHQVNDDGVVNEWQCSVCGLHLSGNLRRHTYRTRARYAKMAVFVVQRGDGVPRQPYDQPTVINL